MATNAHREGVTLTVTVPMPPNIGNGGHYHWRRIHEERRSYLAELEYLFYAKEIPPRQEPLWPKVRISSVMYLGAAMDDDNAMRRHKWVLDFMKGLYFVDDRRSCLEWAGFPEQVIKRDGNYRIEITLSRTEE